MKTFNLVGQLRVFVIGAAVLCGASLVSGVVDAVRLAEFRSALWSNPFYAWNLNWDSLKSAREMLDAFDALSNNAYAQEITSFRMGTTFEDAHAASCRVRVNGARGSGIFFGVDDDGMACILTNYHVVTNNQIAAFDFWKDGRLQTVTGSISWKAYNANEPYDFAIGKVKASELKLIDPPWIPLAGSDAAPKTGAMIVSSGAPDGRFTQAWKGQVLEYYSGKTAIFSPPPVPGQSGSAICEYVDGQLFVTGVLTWLIGEKGRDDSKGGAIPIANLYKALRERGVNVDYVDPNASPIPPNATECATADAAKAKAPCVLEFTQADCPPCKDAENDVAQLRAFGVDVYVYDVATERGAEYAARYGIDRTPSFVLLDEKFKPTGTFTGAGVYSKIRDAHETVIERLRKANNVSGNADTSGSSSPRNLPEGGAASLSKEPPERAASPSSSPVGAASNNASTSGAGTLETDLTSAAPQIIDDKIRDQQTAIFVTPKFIDETTATIAVDAAPLNLPAIAPLNEDFRTREPVFEPAFSMAGIFDKSDERWQDWKNRKRDDEGDEGTEDEDESDGDSCKRPRIGERLADGATEAITQRIEKFADGKVQRMKEDLREKLEAVKLSLLVGLCFIVAIGVLFAEGIIALCKFGWRKIDGKAKEIREAIKTFKETQDKKA